MPHRRWSYLPPITPGIQCNAHFVCTRGNVTDAVIEEYVASQGGEPQGDRDFTVE